MKEDQFPKGWGSRRRARVLAYYENQTEAKAAFLSNGWTVMEIPTELVPAVRELVARHTQSQRMPARAGRAPIGIDGK